MRLVKRAAVTVTPKKPYITWANSLDEDGVKIGEYFTSPPRDASTSSVVSPISFPLIGT